MRGNRFGYNRSRSSLEQWPQPRDDTSSQRAVVVPAIETGQTPSSEKKHLVVNGLSVGETPLEDNSYLLDCGDKFLIVRLPNAERTQALTSVFHNGGEKIQGATTAVYTRAMDLMQAEANNTGKNVNYYFTTNNPSMVAWARAHGATDLGWYVGMDGPGTSFDAHKTFIPINN